MSPWPLRIRAHKVILSACATLRRSWGKWGSRGESETEIYLIRDTTWCCGTWHCTRWSCAGGEIEEIWEGWGRGEVLSLKRKDFTQDSYEAKVVGEAETNKQELGGQTMIWRASWKLFRILQESQRRWGTSWIKQTKSWEIKTMTWRTRWKCIQMLKSCLAKNADLEFRAPLGSSGLPIQRKFPKESSGSRVQSSLGELRTPDSERVPEQCSRNSGPRVQNPFGAFRTPDSERAPQEASKNKCNANAKQRKKGLAAYRTSNLNWHACIHLNIAQKGGG